MPDAAPATTPAQRCPDCGAVLVKDFDEDCGRYWRCDGCDFRASANKPDATPAASDRARKPHELLDELERLHKAATPGRWFASSNSSEDHAGAWSVDTDADEKVLYEHQPRRLVNQVPSEVSEVIADDFRDERDARWVAAAHNAFPALIAGCRAAGAATPPADAPDYCRERDTAYERYMGKRPRDPDGRDEDVWVTSRNAFRAGWNARGALAAGAGAATPALTAAEAKALSTAIDALSPALQWKELFVLNKLRSRLAAGGVAAAPSPAATSAEAHENAKLRKLLALARGYVADAIEQRDGHDTDKSERKLTDCWRADLAKIDDALCPAVAPGPQREEPTP